MQKGLKMTSLLSFKRTRGGFLNVVKGYMNRYFRRTRGGFYLLTRWFTLHVIWHRRQRRSVEVVQPVTTADATTPHNPS